MICDVVSRKPIADITSADETSTETEAVFSRALRTEGIDAAIAQRNPDGIRCTADLEHDGHTPVLLVLSDNGPQMTSHTTRDFMAYAWLAAHYGRPGTPTDQAWIESLFGHVKHEHPHLERISHIAALRAELDTVAAPLQRSPTPRRHRVPHTRPTTPKRRQNRPTSTTRRTRTRTAPTDRLPSDATQNSATRCKLKQRQKADTNSDTPQYTAGDFAIACERLGVTQSTGGVGCALDNAAAESFFSTLQHELVNQNTWATRCQARRDIAAWITDWYNTRRLHSTDVCLT